MNLAIATLLLILCGCATTYQRVGFTGGYSQTQLAPNIFQVSFRGNGYTSRDRASDFALLRAAEVALENGFQYFMIIDSSKSSSFSTYTSPSTSQTTASAYGYGNYAYGSAQTTTYGGQTYLISKPSSNNTIVCFQDKPEGEAVVFDAEFLQRSIRKKYGLAASESP